MKKISNHYKNKRNRREKFIKEYLGGDGNIIDTFIVDKRHPMGLEKHCITENGVIIIYNLKSRKLITKKIARPTQIEKYYKSVGRESPSWLIQLAQYHKELGYNR